VYAGPYRLRPAGLKGIKLAPEVPGASDFDMPVTDFGVPSVESMDRAILMGLQFFQKEGAFYVGCMFGQGRTGTYLACMLKAFGYVYPIKEVRALYNPKAVENTTQEKFVEDYPVDKFRYLIQFMKTA